VILLAVSLLAVLTTPALAKSQHHYKRQTPQNVALLTDQQMVNNMSAFITTAQPADLINILSSLNSPNFDQDQITNLIGRLSGTKTNADQARQTLKTLLANLQPPLLHQAYEVYMLFVNRQYAKATVQGACANNLPALRSGLTALSTAERGYRFQGISFTDLLNVLNQSNNQAKTQVCRAILSWIYTANVDDLKKAEQVGGIYTPTTTTTTQAPVTTTQAPTTFLSSIYSYVRSWF